MEATALAYTTQCLGPRFSPLAFADDGRIFGLRWEGEWPHLRQMLAVYDDGALGDLWDLPSGIDVLAANNRGWLTGHLREPQHAFLFADGILTDLGTLYGYRSSGVRINARGEIAGWTVAPGGGPETWQQGYRAILVKDGRMIDLAPESGDHSRARDINDLGEVVGETIGARGFLYRAGEIHQIGTFVPEVINNQGDIVGAVYARPALARGRLDRPLDLGLPPERVGFCKHLNARGTISGSQWLRTAQPGGNDRGTFIWRWGSYAPVQALFPAGSGWDPSSWPILDHHDRIAGSGLYHGEPHSYLLTPLDE